MKVVETKAPLIFAGGNHKITLPDSSVVTIRETNAEDDEVLSTSIDMDDNSHIHKFLLGIIIDLDGSSSLSISDIMKWKTNNKYYLLLKQRIINHGSDFIFQHICENLKCKKESEYTEDLKLIDADFSKGEIAQDKDNPSRIWSYPGGKDNVIEFTTKQGSKFQFDIMNGESEAMLRAASEGAINKNLALKIRNLRMWDGKEWVVQKYFLQFSSPEAAQIRAWVNKYDQQFNPVTSFSCPFCSTVHHKNIFQIPAFFFPEGLI